MNRLSDGQSDLEAAFAFHWRVLAGGSIAPEREFEFDDDRGWRFDFAWPQARIAVECDGGTWNGGRHVRGKGYRGDCEKCNAAQAVGWRVFHITTDMMADDPAGIVEMIVRVLAGASEEV